MNEGYNKSYVQLSFAKLLDFVITKWDDDKPRNFSRFFSIIKSLLLKYDIDELKNRIKNIESKYQMSIEKIEFFVWQMKFSPKKALYIENIIPNGLGDGWDLKIRQQVNHFEMEKDLMKLREWCLYKIHKFAQMSNINFDKIPEMYSSAEF